jgi:hypothetical protein
MKSIKLYEINEEMAYSIIMSKYVANENKENGHREKMKIWTENESNGYYLAQSANAAKAI